jgi:hypothetical protein
MPYKTQFSISLNKQFKRLITEIRQQRPEFINDTAVIVAGLGLLWKQEVKSQIPVSQTPIPVSKAQSFQSKHIYLQIINKNTGSMLTIAKKGNLEYILVKGGFKDHKSVIV